MKNKRLLELIGEIDDRHIAEAAPNAKKASRPAWLKWGVIAACLCGILIVCLAVSKIGQKNHDPLKTDDPVTLSQNVFDDINHSGTQAQPPDLDGVAIGPLHLGMPRDEIEALLGAPDDISNSGETEIYDGVWMVSWWYGGDNSAELYLIDVGNGWILNEVFLDGNCPWDANGIRIGSSEEDVLARYPDAEIEEQKTSIQDGVETLDRYYSATYGNIPIHIHVINGRVDYIYVGPLIEDTWGFIDDEPIEARYSFSSAEITAYRYHSNDPTWDEKNLSEKEAKKIEVIMGIEELLPADNHGREAVIWLDFHNGTVVALYGEDEAGTVYRAAEGVRISEASLASDPVPDGLEKIEDDQFPAGTWETVNAACH